MFEHILFANSSVEARGIFYDIFANMGYRVTTAPTHQEVLEILKKERPDYIILDPSILNPSADTVTEKIKATDEKIKIITLPSWDNSAIQENCKEVLRIVKEGQNGLPIHKENSIQFKAGILIVDDDRECAQLLQTYLSKKGFNSGVVFSGEEALMKINVSKPDIVLLDLYMPTMDGMLVLKTIKEKDSSIIVIMTTAVTDDKVIGEAMKLGANGYLVKPFNLDKLEETILANALQKIRL